MYNAVEARKSGLATATSDILIWYADLNGPTSDPYPEFEQKPTVIAAKHMNAIDGDVASPAELKRQIDELKAELKEKFHISEQSKGCTTAASLRFSLVC